MSVVCALCVEIGMWNSNIRHFSCLLLFGLFVTQKLSHNYISLSSNLSQLGHNRLDRQVMLRALQAVIQTSVQIYRNCVNIGTMLVTNLLNHVVTWYTVEQ